MRKIINCIFIIFLICFSFFYTDKVINVINNEDPLMKKIINNSSIYEVLPVNAKIDNDTIIPGIIGRKIDIDKSYEKMKIGGIFREESLVFKDLLPSNSLKDNKDKYIIKGSNVKKEVAIIYIFNNNYIDILNQIDNITLFLNHRDITIDKISNLKNKELYSYGNNGLYTDEILVSDNSLINKISNNKSKYCLVKDKNDNVLEICKNNNMYTVIPSIIGGYYEVRNNLSNGSIILLSNLNNIDSIIKYIESKGYNIVTLSNLLSE